MSQTSEGSAVDKKGVARELSPLQRRLGIYKKRHLSPIAQPVPAVLGRMADLGGKVYPTTASLIKRELVRAVKVGTISGEREVALSAAALAAVGIEQMSKEGDAKVKTGHVLRGWRSRFGNCPPHRCFFRSVLSHSEELQEGWELFAELSKESE